MSAKRLERDIFKFQMKMWDRLLPLLSYVRQKGNDLTIWVIPPHPSPPRAFCFRVYTVYIEFWWKPGGVDSFNCYILLSPEISHFMCDIFVITLTCCDNLRRHTCRLRINLSKYVKKNYQNTQNNKECSSDRMGRRSDTDCFLCSHHLTIIFFCN